MAHLAIRLYDPETNEVVKEYTRTFVPWKILKRAIRLMKANININAMSEQDADELAALVVDAFGGQFTLEQLDNGADLGEMMTVLTAIMGAAQADSPNSIPPGK